MAITIIYYIAEFVSQSGAGVDIQFGVDVLDVRVDSPRFDPEPGSDLGIGEAASSKTGNLFFPRCQQIPLGLSLYRNGHVFEVNHRNVKELFVGFVPPVTMVAESISKLEENEQDECAYQNVSEWLQRFSGGHFAPEGRLPI